MHKNQIIHNFLWRLAERTGAQLISFVVTIVLARLLEPEAYGTVALITVFVSILQVFVDSGFGSALIQKKEADDVDFSTVFYFNIFLCIVLYAALFAAAPWIAGFYDDAVLTSMIRMLGIVILISGVKNIQQAYVSRTMQFKRFFWATLSGTLISAMIGIIMAYCGFGAWALIMQNLSNMMIDTLILWKTVKWRPRRLFSVKRLKALSSYAWLLLSSSLIDSFYGNFRQLVIGKAYSSVDLAYYNKGRHLPNMIVTNVNTSLDSVLFPVLSRTQNETAQLRDVTKKAITVSNYVMAPLMMGLAFMAEPLVELVLTSKWLACVPYLRIFCVLYMFQPIHTANTNVIKAVGRGDIRLKQEISTKVIGVILLLASMKHGVMMIAYAYLAGNFANQIINSYPNRKLIGYSWLSQIKDILPATLLAVFMGLCVYAVSFIHLPLPAQIFVQVISGAAIYISGSALLGIDAFFYLLDVVKGWKRRL